MSKQEFEIKHPVNIYRFDDDIKIEKIEEPGNKKLKLTEDEDNVKLGDIIIKDSKYYYKPILKESTNINNDSISSISEISNLSWLVYKGQKIPSNKSRYCIKEGDIIKLGREILLIKDIHLKRSSNAGKINNNETIKDNNGVMVSFHTQTSQSLNLNEDFNNFEDNNNDKNDKSDNETDGNEVNNKPNEKNNNDKKDLISCNSEKNSEIMNKKNKKICRICYMEETNKKVNPLIKPCKCSGSMKYIHYECLLHWLKTKVLINKNSYCDNGFFTIYSLNLIECELCKNHLPNYIKHKNKIYSLIDYEKFDKKKSKKEKINNNFIIFDEITPGKQGTKYRYLVKFDQNNVIKIGRGLEMQLILNDISVSRNHCQLKVDDDYNIILEDCNSKFGTLVLIQAESLEILKGQTLTVQVGTNYLNFRLGTKKNIFGCCDVDEIDEKNIYEKLNSKCVKYDRANEILEESITPENSDNEDEKINDINILKEKNLIDKESDIIKNKINEIQKNEENKNIKNNNDSIYNISTLQVKDGQNKSMPNNIKIIQKRIQSVNSKGSFSGGGSTTKIKNDDKNNNINEENIIESENENGDNQKENDNKKENGNENNKDNHNNKNSDNDNDSDSDDSSDENNSSDEDKKENEDKENKEDKDIK